MTLRDVLHPGPPRRPGDPGAGARPASDPFADLGELPTHVNVSADLRARAAEAPGRAAVMEPDGTGFRTTTYGELEERVDAVARGLAHAGVRRGDEACVFVRAGADLIAIVYALFRLGAVPVLLDPGMGKKPLLSCVERTGPRVFIGIPAAHALRLLHPRAFRTCEVLVTVGPRVGWGGASLARLVRAADGAGGLPIADTAADELAAVLFTSGSTGPAKGVRYTHGMFDAQRRALRAMYDLTPGEVDVACFPLFALFDTALGLTSVFPALDPSRPGSCDPAAVAAALQETGATLTFGSPAIWRRVAPWARAAGRTFPELQRVLIAGAPVPPGLVEELRHVLPERADVHTPYGATESLPVASVSGAEILDELRDEVEGGAGTCVGRPAPGIDLAVISVTDDPIETWSDEMRFQPGLLGELVVRGPVVTQAYHGEPYATALAKIADPAGGPSWHRMGDLGYLDDAGRVWFCGRKGHRLETTDSMFGPVPTENVFNAHPDVHRTALVGIGPEGTQHPALVVQLDAAPPRAAAERQALGHELLSWGGRRGVPVEVEHVLFKRDFPVDVRHNAKIDRERLASWAERTLP